VRDELWEKAVKASKEMGSILQLWSDKNPQGFSFRQSGLSEREIVDFEGVLLVQVNRRALSYAENADTEK